VIGEIKVVLAHYFSDLDHYFASKQLFFLTKENSGNPAEFDSDDMIELIKKNVKEAEKEGFAGLSITGELKGVVDFSGGKEEIINYEWKLNELIFNKFSVSALCRYNINEFDNEVIKAAIELHDYIIWKGELNDNPYYINPAGYKESKVEEYEIKSWLNNIEKFQKKEKTFKKTINNTLAKYSRLYNKAPIGIVKTSSTGKVIQLNQKMLELAGFKDIEEVVNDDYNLAKDFYANPKSRIDFLNKIHSTGEVENFEFEAVKKNGEHCWLMMNAQIVQNNNNVDNYVIEAFVFDISQRKEYENEVQLKREELSATNQQLQAYNEEIMVINEELEDSVEELEKLNDRFKKVISLVSDIENLNTISEEDFLANFLKQAVEIIPEADFGSVYTFGDQYVNFVSCIGYDLEKLKQTKIENEAFFNHALPIEIVDKDEILERNKDCMEKSDFEDLKMTSLNKLKEIMYLDLELNGEKTAGISLDISAESSEKFTNNSKKIFNAFYNIAISFYKINEYNSLQNNFTKEIISSTVKMLEMYDLYTRGHSENFADLAVKIAEEMKLSTQKIEEIYWFGLVHDIGKMLIPIEILNKEDKLTASEYELIKEHPVLGSNALSSSSVLKHIANC
jgi:PAS domain S-box-containing protein